ncbi:MAG: endonuclease MutS2 [Firmicutes bacterium]|nr:endonuclease MutS2 [Bacillota bacterium]
MDNKTMQKLELDKILEQLQQNTSFPCSAELVQKLEPASTLAEQKEMLRETDEAREMLRLYPDFSIGGAHDIRQSLRHLEIGGILSVQELVDVGDTCRAMRRSKEFLGNVKGNFPIFIAAGKELGIFKTIESAVERTVAPDLSILDTASERLYAIRRRQKSCNDRLRERLENIIKSPSKAQYLQEALITVRNGRYVVPVRVEAKQHIPGVVHDTSSSGATLFIEPMIAVELNNELQKLASEEEDEINAVLRALSAVINSFNSDLQISLKILAEIDFMLAKGKLSYDHDGISPAMNDKGLIKLIKARHPLIDKNKVVPVDLKIERNISALVITGPNTGGKTVTLKTVGLFTLMALMGLHIPAESGSELCFYKQIFADIGDEQSIEQSLSTFSAHMANIVHILEKADSNSLVLLDELGSGTDPAEGAALAMSILEYLREKQAKILATTHYSELKAFAYNNQGYMNASAEFDVRTLSPTYKLLMGVPGKSNAFEIATKLGLDKAVIEKANHFLSSEDAAVADMLANLEQMRREAVRTQEEADAALAKAEAMQAELNRELEQVKIREAKLLHEAHEKSRKIVEETAEKSKALYDEIKKQIAEKENAQRVFNENRRKLLDWQKQLEEEQPEIIYEGEAPAKLKAGDTVFIPKFNQQATVLKAADSDGNVQVQAGIVKMMLPISDLRLSEPPETKQLKKRGGALQRDKAMNIKNEVDLRGMQVTEALEVLDKYLDDAMLAGLKQVRIIHGKGTFVLRKAVKEHLQNLRAVKEYRDGDYHEGGIGVTVAIFKD